MYFRDLLKRDTIEEVTAETWKRMNSFIGHVAYVTGRNDDRLWECPGEEPELFSIILGDAKASSRSEILGSLTLPLVQSGVWAWVS
jgi:hypothetical protein